TGKQTQRGRFCASFLALGQLAQSFANGGERNPAEVVTLQTRENRLGHLLRFCGRQDEFYVRGRLFERLEQGVESLISKLVGFVDDVNLESITRRAVAQVFDDGARIVNFTIGGTVDLADVQCTADPDFAARDAFAARFRGGTVLAVEAAGQDTGRGGLADPANSREQESMRDAAALERLAQRASDVFLPNQFGEAVGAPFASQDQMRRRSFGHRMIS